MAFTSSARTRSNGSDMKVVRAGSFRKPFQSGSNRLLRASVNSNGSRKTMRQRPGASKTLTRKRTKEAARSVKGTPGTKGRVQRDAKIVCKRCQSIDFARIFALRAAEIPPGGFPVVNLGTRLNELTSCLMCKFLSSMRYMSADATSTYHLRAYSFFRLNETIEYGMMPRWIKDHDSICLAVVPGGPEPNHKTDVKSVKKHCSSAGYILQTRTEAADGEAFGGRLLCASVDYPTVRSWISYCQEHHSDSCSESGQLVAGLRLIDCERGTIVEAELSHTYAALSYVWGSQERTASIVGCGSATTAGALPAVLPKVIEDAIVVTKAIGLQYLWVDQYCIDQTNSAEKHFQIKRMDSIYERAQITFLAAAGPDQTYGLPGVSSRLRTPQRNASVGTTTLSSTFTHPWHAMRASTWSTRGWTYQEAVLSRRRLVFTDEQTYFECNNMNCCESLWTSLDILHKRNKTSFYHFMRSGFFAGSATHLQFRSFDGHFADGDTDLSRYYAHMKNYTGRKLAFESDSIDAFSGIIQYIAKTSSIRQLWGVPFIFQGRQMSSFCRSLCWYHHEGTVKRRIGFPSWSWVGWEGAIDMPCDYENVAYDLDNVYEDKVVRFEARLGDVSVATETGETLSLEKDDWLEEHFHSEDGCSFSTILVTAWSIRPDDFYLRGGEVHVRSCGATWALSTQTIGTSLMVGLKSRSIVCILVGEYLGQQFYVVLKREKTHSSRMGMMSLAERSLRRMDLQEVEEFLIR